MSQEANFAYVARGSSRLFKIHSRGCNTFFTTPKMALGGADCIVKYDIKYTSSESTVDMLSRVYFELIWGEVRFTLYFTIRIAPEAVQWLPQERSKSPQDSPKKAPRCLKEAPR